MTAASSDVLYTGTAGPTGTAATEKPTASAKPPVTLETLAKEINETFTAISTLHNRCSEHAFEVGRLLNDAKLRVKALPKPRPKWLEWLAKNCPKVSERTAQRYMALDEAKQTGLLKTANLADLSVLGIEQLLLDIKRDAPEAKATREAAAVKAKASREIAAAKSAVATKSERTAPVEDFAVVIGSRRKFIDALKTLDKAKAKEEIERLAVELLQQIGIKVVVV
jgi:hypothetical protein